MTELLTYRQATTYDPSNTTGLRNAFARDMNRRFIELTTVIKKAVLQEDCFGLKLQTYQMSTPGKQAFAFSKSAEKVDLFMAWLRKQVDKGIVDVRTYQQVGSSIEGAWTNLYIYDSYKRGLAKARQELKKAGYDVPSIETSGGIEVAMQNIFHIERVGLLFSRIYNDLKGVTATMDAQISRVLAQGMIDGDGMLMIARKLVATINGTGMGELGITDTLGRFIPAARRAEMIARTEIIRAYAESTLQEFENWGIEGVSTLAEVRTAGDDRVCFPKFIKVATNNGNKKISDIKINDKVLTSNGIDDVINVMDRIYTGDMIALHFNDNYLFCTSDHPIWSISSNGWVKAKDIRLNECVQSVGNKSTQVIGVVNFSLSKSNDIPSVLIKGSISSLIFDRIMPIDTISLNRYFIGDKSKVYQISTDSILLDVRQLNTIQSSSYFSFDGCFSLRRPITSFAAKFNLTCRSFSERFTTMFTSFKNWRSSACFGTIFPIKVSFNVRTFMKEWFITAFAIFSYAFRMCFFATERAIIVSVGNTSFYNEFFITSNTSFFNKITSMFFITSTGTKVPSVSSWSKFYSASSAFAWRYCSVIFCIAFMGTKSMTKFWIIISSSMKRFIAMVTDKCIYYSYRFSKAFMATKLSFSRSRLELFTAIITGNNRHVSFDVFDSASKYTINKLKVYDITVKNTHNFYANDILVHNCEICQSYEGKVYTIAEARGKIPFHPRCRCIWLPWVEELQKYYK